VGGSESRLAAEVRPERGRRLRLAALVAGKPLNRYLDDLLDRQLPSLAELADAIRSVEPEGSDAA
jgi:hypothetical protein